MALRRSSASGRSPDQPAGLPRTSQPPAFWSIASLLAIALTTMGASWSCGPLFVLADGDRACEIVVLHEDGRLDLTCLDALPRACHSDADCLAAERCQASAACLLGPPCREGERCAPLCPGRCVADDPDTEPEPSLCQSDLQCGAGERCNAEELCLRPPGCGPDDICPHVCWGTCEPEPGDDLALCYWDGDCEAGLVCNAAEVCLSPPGCSAELACPAVCAGHCLPPLGR